MRKLLNDESVRLEQARPGLPAALVAAVERALARPPEDRFPDVQAFRQQLLPYVG